VQRFSLPAGRRRSGTVCSARPGKGLPARVRRTRAPLIAATANHASEQGAVAHAIVHRSIPQLMNAGSGRRSCLQRAVTRLSMETVVGSWSIMRCMGVFDLGAGHSVPASFTSPARSASTISCGYRPNPPTTPLCAKPEGHTGLIATWRDEICASRRGRAAGAVTACCETSSVRRAASVPSPKTALALGFFQRRRSRASSDEALRGAKGIRLQQKPHLHDVLKVGLAERRDAYSLVEALHRQAFGDEFGQCLANGDARDPELLGDVVLMETLVRSESAFEDWLLASPASAPHARQLVDRSSESINSNYYFEDASVPTKLPRPWRAFVRLAGKQSSKALSPLRTSVSIRTTSPRSSGSRGVPVREALANSSPKAWRCSAFNKGIRVAPLSQTDFQDIMEMRLLLEPYALRLSAPHLTTRDYDDAEKNPRGKCGLRDSAPKRAVSHWMFTTGCTAPAAGLACSRRFRLSRSRSIGMSFRVWRTVGLVGGLGRYPPRDSSTPLRAGDVKEAHG